MLRYPSEASVAPGKQRAPVQAGTPWPAFAQGLGHQERVAWAPETHLVTPRHQPNVPSLSYSTVLGVAGAAANRPSRGRHDLDPRGDQEAGAAR